MTTAFHPYAPIPTPRTKKYSRRQLLDLRRWWTRKAAEYAGDAERSAYADRQLQRIEQMLGEA